MVRFPGISIRLGSVAILLVVSLLPFFGNAQAASICALVGMKLSQGASGASVTVLQSFLASQGTFSVAPTGYFGPVTATALATWQLRVGIITALADGGAFGPKTSAYISQKLCGTSGAGGSSTVGSASSQCSSPPPVPTSVSCGGSWQKINSTNGCHAGWTCIIPQTAATSGSTANGTSGASGASGSMNTAKPNQAPTIHAIVGPTTREVGELGTWEVKATDPENEALKFSIVWGDEGAALSALMDLARQGGNVSSATSYSHTYTKTGSYTIVVFVRDAANNDNKAVLSVAVKNNAATTTSSTGTSATTTTTTTTTTTSTSVSGSGCYAYGIGYRNGMSTTFNSCGGSRIGYCATGASSLPYYACRNGVWYDASGSNACASNGNLCSSQNTGTTLRCATMILSNPDQIFTAEEGQIDYLGRCSTGVTPCPDQYLLCKNGMMITPPSDGSVYLPYGSCWRSDYFTGKWWLADCTGEQQDKYQTSIGGM